jgi:hypothetical protein
VHKEYPSADADGNQRASLPQSYTMPAPTRQASSSSELSDEKRKYGITIDGAVALYKQGLISKEEMENMIAMDMRLAASHAVSKNKSGGAELDTALQYFGGSGKESDKFVGFLFKKGGGRGYLSNHSWKQR